MVNGSDGIPAIWPSYGLFFLDDLTEQASGKINRYVAQAKLRLNTGIVDALVDKMTYNTQIAENLGPKMNDPVAKRIRDIQKQVAALTPEEIAEANAEE